MQIFIMNGITGKPRTMTSCTDHELFLNLTFIHVHTRLHRASEEPYWQFNKDMQVFLAQRRNKKSY